MVIVVIVIVIAVFVLVEVVVFVIVGMWRLVVVLVLTGGYSSWHACVGRLWCRSFVNLSLGFLHFISVV